jgi:hypothetical protein
MYFQFLFAPDRVKALAPQHPEWKDKEPFASLLKGDMKGAQAGDGARLAMLVLHDDDKREYAYGPAQGLRDTESGTFSDALMAGAKKSGWTVISMKADWKVVFPVEEKMLQCQRK